MPQLQIFDPAYFNTVNCPVGLMTTPAGTYCQMMGPYEMPLNDYNTVAMYPGVNNNCPSQARLVCGGHFGVGSSFPFKRRRVNERCSRAVPVAHRDSQWPSYDRCPPSDPKCQC